MPIEPIDCLRISQARICMESDTAYLTALTITAEQLERLRALAIQYEAITANP